MRMDISADRKSASSLTHRPKTSLDGDMGQFALCMENTVLSYRLQSWKSS